jgi:hypothetical protein
VLGVLVVLGACTAGPTRSDRAPRGADRPASPALPAPLLAAAPAVATAAPAPTTPPTAPSCVRDGHPFDEATLLARLEALAAPELDGRFPGTAGDVAARALIAERFRCLGLAPAGDDDGYAQAFTDPAGHATANVVGYITGASRPSEIIVVGAHHDHLGGGHLGANDNASGVVALLAIAQAIRQQATAPARTIAFVTFGAEEQGLAGSLHFVAHPPAALPLARVVQYINLDMVGSHDSRRVVYAFGAFARMPSHAILADLEDAYPKLHVGIGGHSVRGDQVGFCKAGIPYVFLWTPDARCYHAPCDTVGRLDLPRLADIAGLAADLVAELASSDVDLAATKRRLGCLGR